MIIMMIVSIIISIMKDKYYGFVAGLILGDTKLATKKRGYSDNTAVFLCIMDCYTRQEVSPIIIMQEIDKCYSEKGKYVYASPISFCTIKPSLAIALRRWQNSGEILPSQNMEMSADIIFRALVPLLLQRFTTCTCAEIVAITHGAPMTHYYLTFLNDFFKLIFDGVPKKGLQKFASGRGFSEDLLNLEYKRDEICAYLGETIRRALHLFFMHDGYFLYESNCLNVKSLYGIFVGSFYGFKYLHENNLVKIDADIMDLLHSSYSV